MVESWWRPFAAHGGISVVHVDLAPHPRPRVGSAGGSTAASGSAAQGSWCSVHAASSGCAARHCARCCAGGSVAGTMPWPSPPRSTASRSPWWTGAPAPVSFNVSHSGCHGLIAVAAGGRIGVDIEERVIRHDIDGVLRTAFAPDEQADLAAASGRRKTELLFRLWTMKEALIKALGSGLSLDTASFTLPAGLRRGAERSALYRFPWMPGVEWVLSDLSDAKFAAALAHDGDAGRPT